MANVVPTSLLFDFRPRLCHCGRPSKKKSGSLLSLPDAAIIFQPSRVNETVQFAMLKLGWNEDGLGGELTVSGKTAPPRGDVTKLDTTDSLSVWLDTRPSGSVHRATEYCHSFGFVPATDSSGPQATVLPIAQQRASRVESNVRLFGLRTQSTSTGYTLEFWIPGTQLHGFREITEFGRLGFHAVVHDSELGEQSFSLADDFPTSYDPSTWTQLELQT
ncbi:MAG: hypothetical protein NXI04_17245 [Planctomycetaceae bacterium]|nr:hypothetical protein [Planctomycetaceae bacterium]